MHPRILLLNPPTEGVKNTVRDLLYGCWCSGKRIAGATFPPLSLLSLYTILKNNAKPIILDYQSVKWNFDKFLNFVAKFEGIVMPVSDESISEDIKLLKSIKERSPDIKTFIFGSYCTFFPEQALAHNEIDSIAIGEPEPSIQLFPKIAMNSNINMEEIPNGIGLKINNRIIINEPKFDYPLDSLPIPDRIPIKDIYYYNPLTTITKWTTALTSRGCPGTCNFCTSPFFYGKKYRYHSFEWIKKEAEYLQNMGFKEIFYRDETFTVNRKRLHQFTDWIIHQKIDLKWIINVRVGTVNYNDLVSLKKAGCHTIKVGVESGSKKILSSLNKGISPDDTIKLFDWCKKIGLRTHAHMILGAPGESIETFRETREFLSRIQPNTVTFNLFTPLPGTAIFYDLKEKYQDLSKNLSRSMKSLRDFPVSDVNYTQLPNALLKTIVKRAYADFYFNPRTLKNILLSIRSGSDLSRILKAGLNVLEFIFGKN